MKEIKMLVFRVYSDGDFYWDSKTFPREINECGYKTDDIIIYFDNPTIEDINKVLLVLAEDFENSFNTSRETLNSVKNDIVQKLVSCAFENKFENKGTIRNYVDIDYTDGNYGMNLKLFSFTKKNIKFYNTQEEERITMIEPLDFLSSML